MREIMDDFWTVQKYYDGICCTTNSVVKADGRLVMGKGIAYDFAKYYPKLTSIWGTQVKRMGIEPLILCSPIGHERYAIYFQTKHHWKDRSSFSLIVRSMTKLGEMIERLSLKNVLMPRPGCSNGGLSWEHVRDELGDTFDFDEYPYSTITFIGKA